MKYLVWVLCSVCLGIAQVAILDYFVIFNVKPDLLLSLVIVASLSLKEKQALSLSIVSGIMQDALGARAFGINTLLFVLWSLCIIQLSKKFTLDVSIVRLVLVCVVVFLHHLLLAVALFLFGGFIATGVFLRILVLETLITTAISPLIFNVGVFLNAHSFYPRPFNVQSKEY